jgi:hypothetical protein
MPNAVKSDVALDPVCVCLFCTVGQMLRLRQVANLIKEYSMEHSP